MSLAYDDALCRCVPRRDCPHADVVARWQSRVSGSSNQCTAINDVIPSRLLSLSRGVNVSSAVEFSHFWTVHRKMNITSDKEIVSSICLFVDLWAELFEKSWMKFYEILRSWQLQAGRLWGKNNRFIYPWILCRVALGPQRPTIVVKLSRVRSVGRSVCPVDCEKRLIGSGCRLAS